MRRHASTDLKISLLPCGFIRIGVSTAVECACCQGILEVHQPDLERPDRLLGTCAECGSWFLIDNEARVMLPLPDLRVTRDG
jgi:hypothetical protein